jgi:TP901 family phage tail tape measure protein
MSANIGELRGRLTLDDEFSSELDSAVNRFDINARRIDTIGTKMMTAGRIVTAGLTAPIVGLGVTSSLVFAEFEKQMNQVQAVTDTSAAHFKMLEEQAKKLGAETQYTARDAAEGMGYLAQAGLTANQIFGAMPSVLQLAAAANMEMGRAADITTNVMYGYGKTVEELPKINDVLVKSFIATNTNLEQLSVAFKYAGPVAHSAGVEFEDTAAALSLMGNAGIQASMAGTGLRGAITRLLDPTAKVQRTLDQLGVTVKDTAGRLLPLDQIVQQLEPHAENTGAMMAIFGQRAGPAMLALVSQGSGALRALRYELEESGGTAKRVAEIQMEGLRGSWLELESASEGLAITVGGTLSPAIQAVMDTMTRGVRFLQSTVVPAFQALPVPIQVAAGGLALFAAAIGPTLIAMGMLIRVIGFATLAWETMTGTMLVTTAVTGVNNVLFTLGNTVTVLTARVWLLDASEKANAVTSGMLATAKNYMAAAALSASLSVTTLGARVIATDIAQKASLITTRALTLAKGVLTTAVNLVGNSFVFTAAKIWLAEAASRALTITNTALSVSVGLVTNGLRLLWAAAGPVAIAIGAIYAAWKIGQMDSVANKIAEWTLRLQGYSAEAAKAAVASHNLAREQNEAFKEGRDDRLKELKDRISGLGAKRAMQELTEVTLELARAGKTTPDVMHRIAVEAEMMAQTGIKLSPALQNIVDHYGSVEARVRAAAPPMQTMTERLRETQAALASLTPEIKNEIAAGLEMGMSVSEIVKSLEEMYPQLDLNEQAIELYTRSLDKSSKAADKSAEAHEKMLARMRESVEYFNFADFSQANQWGLAPSLKDSKKDISEAMDIQVMSIEDLQKAAEETQRWVDKHGLLKEAVKDSKEEIKEALEATETWGQTFNDIFEKLPNIIMRAFTGGGDIGKSIGGLFGGGIMDKITGTMKDGLFGGGAGKWLQDHLGKTLGGVLGSALPGLGTALGGLLGGMADKVFGKLFKSEGKEVNNLRDKFTEAAGGIRELERAAAEAGTTLEEFYRADTIEEYERAIGNLEEAFEALEERRRETIEGLSDLSARGGLIGADLLKAVKDNLGNEEVAEAFRDFQKNETNRAADGINTFLMVRGTVQEELSKAKDELAKLGSDASADDIKKAKDKVAELEAKLARFPELSQKAAEAFSGALLGVYADLVEHGASPIEALERIGPGIQALQAQLSAAGIDAGPAFAELASMAAMATDEISGPLIEGVHGIGQGLIGLHNTGLLTEDMFAGLAEQVGASYLALEAQGRGGQQALRMMQPTLQTLWELQEDFGYELDDTTQSIVDQAEASGLVGDSFREAGDRMVAALDTLIGRFDLLLEAFGVDIPDSADDAATDIEDSFNNLNINPISLEFDWEIPDFQFPNVPGGGAVPMAEGGVVTKPTFALIGEAGPEAVVPLDRSEYFQRDGSEGGTVVNQVAIIVPKSGDDRSPRQVVREGLREAFPDYVFSNEDGILSMLEKAIAK